MLKRITNPTVVVPKRIRPAPNEVTKALIPSQAILPKAPDRPKVATETKNKSEPIKTFGAPKINFILETKKAKAAFLVAGFCSPLGLSLDEKVKTFLTGFHWQKIQSNCPSFTIMNSDNDPYVPITKAQELAQNLNSPLTIIHKAGHFNQTTFLFLLEKIKEQL